MTLHDRIRAVVEDRLRIARAANPSPWRRITDKSHLDPNTIFGDGSPRGFDKLRNVCSLDYSWERDANAAHIVANDPADAILSAEHALSVLERHRPGLIGGCGADCREWYPYPDPEHIGPPDDGEWRFQAWPCIEIRELATRWRVEVDG